MRKLPLFTVLFLMTVSSIFGAYLSFQPMNLSQPDGTKLELFATGDEFYNWLHDKNGYTIKQNDKGWYVFLDKNTKDELVYTDLVVGKDNPENSLIKPWTNISTVAMKDIRTKAQTNLREIGSGRAPTTGTLNNLVIFIRFSDQTEFGENLTNYSSKFNGTTGNTMQSYFLEASYNALDISTTFYPTPTTTVVSWQDSNPRAYYSPYNATTNPTGYNGDTERTNREFTLLVNAVNGVSSQVPTGLNLDGDNDGRVDNVCFIIKGPTDAWASLLWPHRWSIYDRYVYINGKRVYDFNFQLSEHMATSGVGVLCHEMFHSLGAPDLYHYSYDGLSTVGSWDLMENNANPPQHMGAFMKYKYGHWISTIPTISTDGTYYLNPLTSSTGQCFRINSPNSTTEYFVVEYRRKTGTFENSIPGTGMLVYRINTTVGDGNADGPPDEVYLYRPGGTTTINGTINAANYSSETGRTAINSTTNPTPFLTSGAAGGLNINTIGSAGTTISFVLGNPIPGSPVCTITAPTDGAFFNLNETVPVAVTATDSDGTISNVKFYIDDVLQYTDSSSPYTWNWNTTGFSGGYHAIKAVATDNSALTAQSTVTIALVPPADEGFETGNFNAYPWTQSGNLPWFIQTADKYSGIYAARSGAIGDSQSSTMSVTLNITSPGSISFFQKVSSESGWDFLRFYIDDVEQGVWSGAGSWSFQSYPVTSGTHTFSWTYSKDTNTTGGSDCAWLDHITFPPHGVYYAPPQNLIGAPGNNQVILTWQAPGGATPTGYKIFKNGSLLTMVTGLTYTDNAVVNGTTYSYYLTAVYAGGESEPTPTVQVTPNLITSVIIGSGTSSNATNAACPINVYYQSLHGQAVYTAAELNAAGVFGPIDITQIGFNVTGLPTLAMPNYIVRMGHTTASNVASWISTGLSTYWSATSYQPTSTGWNMLTLSTPFTWNGTDNIVIDTAFGLIGSWNQSGTTMYTTVTSGYRYSWNDYSDQTDVFSGGYSSSNRPNLQLTLISQTTGPEIVVDPASLAFGAVVVGNTNTLQFTIENTGDEILTGNITTPAGYSVALASRIDEVSKALPETTKSERNTISYSVNGGAVKTYNLTFAPTAVQSYNGNVVISSNDPDHPSVNITVTGVGYIPPTISIDNNSLFASLSRNQQGTDSFTISNLGSQNLSFSIAESPAVAWFSASPATGVIGGSGSQLITGSFNANGMSPGTYETTLLVNSNDPNTPQTSVTVEMEVINTAPTIALPSELSFEVNGSLEVDFSSYVNDVDGQVLTLGYSGNTNILVSINGLNVTFTATPDWYGWEEITFSVFDGYSYAYDTALVSVLVNHLNTPVINSISKTAGGITLQWEPVPYASYYTVFRSLDPYGTFSYIGSTYTTSYADSQVYDNAFYKIVAEHDPPVR